MDDPAPPDPAPQPPPPPGFIPADQLLAGLERRPLFKRTDDKANPSDNLGNVIVYLSSLYTQLKEDEQRPAPAAVAPVETGQKLLQSRRLSRSGASLEQRITEFGQRSDAVNFTNTALAQGGAIPGFTGGWDENSRLVRLARWLQRQGVTLAVACLVSLAGFGVMTALFLRAHGGTVNPHETAANHRATGVSVEDQVVTDEALNYASLALNAVERGDLAKAAEALEEAHNRKLVLPGICYQGALLALGLRDEEKLELWTDRAVAANEAVPECLYLHANGEAFKSDFKTATALMETASRNAPFAPRYLFFWAECLRRQGTPRLALPQFRQALLRRPTLADTELILFKTGLARIETGDDPTIQADLAEKMAREPVSGDTLLLAAANEINRNAYPAAAEFLRRAGRAMPPTTLRVRLRDYVFRTRAEQPDIAPVWTSLMSAIAANAPAQPGHKLLIDPATRGLGEADPAAW